MSLRDGSGLVGLSSLPSHSMWASFLFELLRREDANDLSTDTIVCLSSFSLFFNLRTFCLIFSNFFSLWMLWFVAASKIWLIFRSLRTVLRGKETQASEVISLASFWSPSLSVLVALDFELKHTDAWCFLFWHFLQLQSRAGQVLLSITVLPSGWKMNRQIRQVFVPWFCPFNWYWFFSLLYWESPAADQGFSKQEDL